MNKTAHHRLFEYVSILSDGTVVGRRVPDPDRAAPDTFFTPVDLLWVQLVFEARHLRGIEQILTASDGPESMTWRDPLLTVRSSTPQARTAMLAVAQRYLGVAEMATHLGMEVDDLRSLLASL